MTDMPLRIDEIESGPVVIVERTPDPILAVERSRIVDALVLCHSPDVVQILLEAELRCVHPDDNEPLFFVFLGPGTQVGECAPPVDAGVSPEIDEDHFAAQAFRTERWRVEPRAGASE